MTATGPPAPFTPESIDDVATERDVDAGRLAELVADHQALMRRLPGVENLLYEWRKQFDATVLERSDRWYVVDAPAWVWDEFASSLSATDAALDALAVVHARTAAELATESTPDLSDATPIVLVREP